MDVFNVSAILFADLKQTPITYVNTTSQEENLKYIIFKEYRGT